jgi:outer membrane protein assembly factor BamB
MRFVWVLLAVPALNAVEWTQFRGPNGSGVATSRGSIPSEFVPAKAAWKTPLPPGFSSPVLTSTAVITTAHEGVDLYTIAVNRKTGAEMWKAEAPAKLPAPHKGVNTPVSPTPATDGENAYVFFGRFGLISYDANGKERWRHPLGPFNAPYGVGASPVIAGDRLVLVCDQDTDSFLIALNKDTGTQLWRTGRERFTHGFSTPVIYKDQVIVSGSYELVAYSLATGEKLWWVTGMAWQAKSVPVIHDGLLYVHSWMASLPELGHKAVDQTWEQALAALDKNKDQRIGKEEYPDETLVKIWFLYDLNKDGTLDSKEWDYLLARDRTKNGLYAIRLGGRGDVTNTHVLWRHEKSLPNIPSPLIYGGLVYVLKEGGILTTLDAKTGTIVKQGRIEGAIDPYYASPVAAAGKIITVSQPGKVAVLSAGEEWKTLSVTDFEEEIWATPAIEDGDVFIRTQKHLYGF